MRWEKKIADGITWARVAIGAGLGWLGWQYGASALATAAWWMLADWVGDVLDGAFARRDPHHTPSWIGKHDLEVDIFVSLGLAVYLWQSDFIPGNILAGYLAVCLLVFLAFGFHRSLGMLFQAPAYGLLILKTLQREPLAGTAILIGLLVMIVVTWPRFPEQVIPGFLSGIKDSLDNLGKRRGI